MSLAIYQTLQSVLPLLSICDSPYAEHQPDVACACTAGVILAAKQNVSLVHTVHKRYVTEYFLLPASSVSITALLLIKLNTKSALASKNEGI